MGRRIGVLLALSLATLAAACGDGNDSGAVARAASPGDTCAARGLSADGTAEGRCMVDGQRHAFVNRGSELRLATIAVRLEGIAFDDTIEGEFFTETARGTYAVVSLTVRNLTRRPQSFSPGYAEQALLVVGGRRFTQAVEVENGPEQHSFRQQDVELRPGAEQLGVIVFDVPRGVARRLERDGHLIVADFGVDLSYDQHGAELGVIRLAR
jgi:hypothetical protein